MRFFLNITAFSFTMFSFLNCEGIQEYSIANFQKSNSNVDEEDERPEEYEESSSSWCDDLMKGVNVGAGFDTFRGIPDGSWAGNSGFVFAADFLVGLEKERAKFGIQAGGSYGVYDWDGRGLSIATSQTDLQNQGYITGAVFASTPNDNGFMINFAYDLLVASDYGVFALDILVDQVRGNLGYTFHGHDRIGAWVTYFIQTDNKEISEIPVQFRAIPQMNLYWTHFFKNSSHLTFWGGIPYGDSMIYTTGRSGNYTIGMDFTAVLDDKWSLVAFGSYMGSHEGQPFSTASNYANNIGFLLTYNVYGRKDKASAVMANNSNFLVDTNVSQ